jgi:hypothetical protein
VRIVEVYSHLNGREFLQVHKPALWDEITGVIGIVDAHACRTKVSKEARSMNELLFSAPAMNSAMKIAFEKHGWHQQRTSYWVTSDAQLIRKTMNMRPSEQRAEIKEAGLEPIASYNQTDFVKDRVAVEAQFGKYSFVAYDLFVKHMAFYVGNVIDVGIEILPMKELQADMTSGPGYYEAELYNVLRQGRGIPAVPLVLIGVAP